MTAANTDLPKKCKNCENKDEIKAVLQLKPFNIYTTIKCSDITCLHCAHNISTQNPSTKKIS